MLLGAAEVVSVDYDKCSVSATLNMRRMFQSSVGIVGSFRATRSATFGEPLWRIYEGSALESEWLWSLGTFDVVYSWGVLHHTGDMWKALANVAALCRQHGTLWVSLYQKGPRYESDLALKRRFNSASTKGKIAMIKERIKKRGCWKWAKKRRTRGMTHFHDVIDWLGGLPYEVADLSEIQPFFEKCGYVLTSHRPEKQGGCSNYLFKQWAPDKAIT